MTQEIIAGPDGLVRLAARLAELGVRRVLILCAPSRRVVDRVLPALAAFQPVVFDGAKVHVPVEVVEAAAALLAKSEADAVVAVGGGSAIGLGKALRLGHDVRFAAVPTTYSGSEMTSIHGTTRGAEKQTGRDDRVRPDLVVHDATLGATMPISLTVQSLANALAHVVSVLSTGSMTGEDRARALGGAGAVARAMEDLVLFPTDPAARAAALEGAAACGASFDRGKAGAQHGLAHLLGGAFGLPHAALHSVLLVQFIAWVRERDAALVDEIERAVGRDDLEPWLHDLLARAGAPTSLEQLGVDAAAARRALAARPDLPAAIVEDALHGLRPTGRAGRIDAGSLPLALLAGPRPENARRVVLALHGRGAEAGGIVRRYREIVGHDAGTAVVGLRAEDGGNRWYGIKASVPGAGADPEVARALARVEAALASLPRDRTVLAGFSQGSCLALEYAARHGAKLPAVIAPAGVRIGAPSEWPPGALAGLPVLVGAAAADPHLPAGRVDETAAWFRAAGAAVEVIHAPGDRHDISLRQRLRAREMLLGRRAVGPTGFGTTVSSEAIAGALPPHQNSPRRAPHGLYPEQVNATGFTAPRAENRRTWLYRIRPSAQRRAFAPLEGKRFAPGYEGRPPEVNLGGFAPISGPGGDFVDGMVTLGGAGSASMRRGYAVHRYLADRDMERRAFYDADGDLLIVPDEGALTLMTELGPLDVAPGQIAIVPRGVLFCVHIHASRARGTVAEVFGRHFELPERGPIGANGLADPRHFRAPVAWYEDKLAPDFRIVAKLGGRLHQTTQDHSPFDVVAWYGTLYPTVYDVADFTPVSGVRVDHTDPSVYTVVSAPLDEPGAHALDLIMFVPRWEISSGTFRPPFFHRNVTMEINGIVRESHAGPFAPNLIFITPPFTGHGTSGRAVERIRALTDADADRAVPPGDSLWYQFESALPMSLTPWAEEARISDWPATWGSHRSHFEP